MYVVNVQSKVVQFINYVVKLKKTNIIFLLHIKKYFVHYLNVYNLHSELRNMFFFKGVK